MTVFGILRIIPLVSSASSTVERLETRNAVIIVLALLELVHIQIKTDCTRQGQPGNVNVKILNIWRYIRPISLAILPYVGYYGYIYNNAYMSL